MSVGLLHGSGRERVLYNYQINLVDEIQSESSVLWRFKLTVHFPASSSRSRAASIPLLPLWREISAALIGNVVISLAVTLY